MKNTYITIIVLIILVVGTLFFFGMGKKAEAPILVADSPKDVFCTMDAKMCPDGSYVGRTGPNCEFASCPKVENVQAVKEFFIFGKNFSFEPAMITVKKGDKVKIIFENTSGFHDFVIDEFGIATKQTNSPTTEILEFTADKTGSFEYYCSVGTHRAMGMKGIFKVE